MAEMQILRTKFLDAPGLVTGEKFRLDDLIAAGTPTPDRARALNSEWNSIFGE